MFVGSEVDEGGLMAPPAALGICSHFSGRVLQDEGVFGFSDFFFYGSSGWFGARCPPRLSVGVASEENMYLCYVICSVHVFNLKLKRKPQLQRLWGSQFKGRVWSGGT